MSGKKTRKVNVTGHFSINNLGLLRQLAVENLGIVALPDVLVENVEDLEQVLPDWSFSDLDINAVMSSRLYSSPTQVFLEFLVDKLGAD